MAQVTIYTRGVTSALGVGGYGVVLVHGDHCKEFSGALPGASNNRMDIVAVIAGLKALKYPCTVTVYSTNTYLTDAVEKGWIKRWQANGWINSEKRPIAHAELWETLAGLCSTHHVSFVWRKVDFADNNYARCDALAHEAASVQAVSPACSGIAASPAAPEDASEVISVPLSEDILENLTPRRRALLKLRTGCLPLNEAELQKVLPDKRAAAVTVQARSLREVAVFFGISKERVRQIEARCLQSLRPRCPH